MDLDARLRDLPNQSDEGAIHFVEERLLDRYTPVDRSLLQRHYDTARSTDPCAVYTGALAFWLLNLEVAAADDGRPSAPSRLNSLLSPALWSYLQDPRAYAVSLPAPDYLAFHRSGTTSIILVLAHTHLDGTLGPKRVLKLLKGQYLRQPAIEDRTARYREECPQDFQFVPTVHQCGPRWVYMDYVKGLTLSEYQHSVLLEAPDAATEVRGIFGSLAKALHSLAISGYIHGDLNPNNILIDPDTFSTEDRKTDGLHLIDFGVNYLITDRVGSSGDLARAGVYVAPEVRDSPGRASLPADLYSLGVILLQLWSGRPQLSTRDFDGVLDQVRENDPGLAAILDELLAAQPDLRLFDLQHRYGANPPKAGALYEGLWASVDLELRLRDARLGETAWPPPLGWLLQLVAILTLDFQSMVDARLREAQVLQHETSADKAWDYPFRRQARRMGTWSLTASLMHVFVLAAAVLFGIRYFHDHTLSSALPGLIVCLAFSALAAKYYLRIYSNLDSRHLGIRGNRTNVLMRFCTLYWPAPIVICYAVDPQWWPYVCAFGVGVVALNNHETHGLAEEAAAEIREAFDAELPSHILSGLDSYRGWGEVMIIFSLSFLGLGVLLHFDMLTDVWAYAAIVMILVAKMWIYNCGRDAPKVRNVLHFLYFRYRRALRFRELFGGTEQGA